ncbi:alpha-L-fucosidase [Fibrella aquatilis]|uniref:alpha-L-fucosidase n=1 Tax=Fibrella aquatilis TaxID=2817059 RepID=A0A939G1K5_9BACT|nr:alpha-L-fucosidase [Fibrella aquatilis]MBO0930181.1 alpha-L-fucosidase [Fibrella aquatilis]
MKINTSISCCFLILGFFLMSARPIRHRLAPDKPRAYWMKGKYGLMVHWLAPGPPSRKGAHVDDLNKATTNFDIDGFMADFDKTGADWLIFTMGQNTGFYASPNAVIDSLAGSGHTPRRDLALDIAKAVKKRGKQFIAYLPCEVRANKAMHQGFGWNTQPGTDQAEFQKKYLKAIREWAIKFGPNLDGWWFDGCYTWDAFPNKYMQWEDWYAASRAGNKNAVITFNDGSFCANSTKPIINSQDYLSGEVEVLIDGKIRLGRKAKADGISLFMPKGAYVDGTQCLYHALLPIDACWEHGTPWDPSQKVPFTPVMPKAQDEMETPVYTDKELIKFVANFTKVGGAVTLNAGIFQEGRLGPKTIKQLKILRESLKKEQSEGVR